MTIPAQVAKAIIGVLDWGLSIQDAIAAPTLYVSDDLVIVEKSPQGEALVAMVPALEKLGHRVSAFPLGSKANGLERTATGWRGGADPRSEGNADGF
jgi:gamma-glutamyltranspeptidase / glutathione hydrolase